MNIYRINIWGPYQNENEVLSRRADKCDDTAVVFAPTRDVANQVCYLAATRNARGQSTYQEIDSLARVTACVLSTREDPIVFDAKVVEGLLSEPILPRLDSPDTQANSGALFAARCVDSVENTRGEFWVYAEDEISANAVVTEHGENHRMFALESEAIRVELCPMEQACVFWNVETIQYSLGAS